MSETCFNCAVHWLLGADIEGEHSNDAADKGGDSWYGLARRWNQGMPWPPTREQAIALYKTAFALHLGLSRHCAV
ncbi:glycosyl hydrolase 108 family protein [Marinobacterium rhizophilum]|uniref:glycosyl hydrolase 108 family protein n=1 Tax=Marinobacterium rhizophilum TaxID=420402 RepID=UPI000364A2F7|nr:glycosyl hydrolase 108 family protein [Marinobacterium rhizophilum]